MENRRKTPIMGWASWNCFRTNITEDRIKEQIDALKDTGLAECGYVYCNMDDGFFGGRDSNGNLQFHKERFPNGIKVIADYAHSKGLKAGIYSEGGDKTCGFYYDNEGDNGNNVGLYGHEEKDLKMYLEDCGFDFIKVDWCGGLRLGLDECEQYTKIGRIIDDIRNRTGKSIVYNICRWQFPGAWAKEVADSWRTGADICPQFTSVMHQLDNVKPLRKFSGQGHINDLDMMQIGNGMSLEDERTHFAMWCMMSTPLIIGCDLTKINTQTLEILKNKELIEINQDSACLQAYVVKEFRSNDEITGEVWIKDLGEENSKYKAVAFLNRGETQLDMEVTLAEIGFGGKVISARDLHEHKTVDIGNEIKVSLKPHEVAVYKIECENSVPVCDINEPTDDADVLAITKIDIKKAMELQNQGACIVDVREKNEYDDGHMENAINIPYTDIHAVAGNYLCDKNQNIVVYCATGKRSLQAYTSLKYLGYKQLYYLGGVDIF